MKHLTQTLLSGALVALSAVVATAETIVVQSDGSGDYATIQAAVDAAESGDIIELAPGTFTGDGNRDVDLLGKAIEIRSQGKNAEGCTIDVEGSEGEPHRAFLLANGEDSQTSIRFLEMTGGQAAGSNGGAILCDGSSPIIEGCIFEDNHSGNNDRGGAVSCENGSATSFIGCSFNGNTGRQGGAVSAVGSAPTFDDCSFQGNSVIIDGGALYGLQSTLEIDDCRFVQNATVEFSSFGGAIFCDVSTLNVSSSLFHGNSAFTDGGAIALGGATALIQSSTFVENVAQSWYGVGGSAIFCSYNATVTVEDSILAFGLYGGAVVCEKAATISFSCSNIYGNEGGDWFGPIEDQAEMNGNLSENPLFCNRKSANFTLAANSPCLSDNNECSVQMGAFGSGCDPIPVVERSWGAIKQQFRAQ